MKQWTIALALCLFTLPATGAQEEAGQEKPQEKIRIKTESITVEAKLPKDLPYATTSEISGEQFELFKPRDLTDVLSYTSGTYVSTGSKNEWGVKIRGLANSRITLLYDGVPMYEPYYNSFDLKTVAADQVETVKVVKGASSVLYGPNALGGIVDVITRRPDSNLFSLRTDYGSRNTYGMYANGAVMGKNLIFTGSAFREGSDGFNFVDSGRTESRLNSDYVRHNAAGKLFYYPGGGTELMAELNYYQSEFGIPTAASFYRARYWRFKDWQRWLANFGGSFPILNGGYVKARMYYVKHYNVLDAYRTSAMDTLQWESTYDNYALGAFVLGMVPLGERNDLNASFTYRDDDVSTQSDLNEPWEKYNHKTVSFGLEDHVRITEQWELMGGASADHLIKQSGENKTTLNPIGGVKFNPQEYVDVHVTLSQKSRFPSMRNLYGTTGGNPDLLDEKGTNVELGATYDREIFLSGAVFDNRIRDMIDSRIDSAGDRRYVNIARALIRGFELEARKSLGPMSFSANYTYLSTENRETGDRLDLIPTSQINFTARYFHPKFFSLTFRGLHASDCIARGNTGIVTLDPYTVTHVIVERRFNKFDLYFRVENLLNEEYLTEPGFPMKSRTITAGMRFSLENIQW